MSLVRSPIRPFESNPCRSPKLSVCPHNDSFHTIYNALLSTTYASNWAYPHPRPATGTDYTVPVNSAVTFDGATWITANGTWPSGYKKWMLRFTSSDTHDTAITKTMTLDGVNWPFTIRTHAEVTPEEDVLFGGDPDVKIDGVDVVW